MPMGAERGEREQGIEAVEGGYGGMPWTLGHMLYSKTLTEAAAALDDYFAKH